MKISKQARRDAKGLFRLCRVGGVLDEARVLRVVQQVAAGRPRGCLAILEHLKRLVKLDLDRRSARVESPVPLSESQQSSLQASLARRYGPGLIYEFAQNPALIGGLRVKVGFDVFDGSVRARLASLDENL